MLDYIPPSKDTLTQNGIQQDFPCKLCEQVLKVLKNKDDPEKQESLEHLKGVKAQRDLHSSHSCLINLISFCPPSSRDLLQCHLVKELWNVNQLDEDGNDALKTAIIKRFPPEFVLWFLDAIDTQDLDKVLSNRNKFGDTCLALAVNDSQDAMVAILMSTEYVDGMNIDSKGNCLLHFTHKFKHKISWKKYIPLLKDSLNVDQVFPLQSLAENNMIIDVETFKRMVPSKEVVNTVSCTGNTLICSLFEFRDWFTYEFFAILFFEFFVQASR